MSCVASVIAGSHVWYSANAGSVSMHTYDPHRNIQETRYCIIHYTDVEVVPRRFYLLAVERWPSRTDKKMNIRRSVIRFDVLSIVSWRQIKLQINVTYIYSTMHAMFY